MRELVLDRVLQVDPDRVPDLDPDDGARDRPAERPDTLDVALGDSHLLLGDHEVDVVDLAVESLGRDRVVRDGRRGVGIGRDTGLGRGAAVVVRRRRIARGGALNGDRAFHPRLFMTRDRADERSPSAGTSTSTVAVSPAFAWAISPPANVMSWGIAPVLVKATS